MRAEKLLAYGFVREGSSYTFRTGIVQDQFELTVTAGEQSTPGATVTDRETGDEYVLHRVPSATGSFVASVRSELEQVLADIAAKCFESDVFKGGQARELISYVRERYGDELEFLWEKTPRNAVWRRKDTGKWYAALLTVDAQKIGIEAAGTIEIIDIRIKPEDMERTVDNRRFFPGYHMNKRHWLTIPLDARVPTPELCGRIDASYLLATK